ncbi:HAD family hydrolase [Kordiimonas pumila]|uniref:HAD family hydrolase n=1 Tax=Kordiimonas pumila TaxID=2161677 RepID=A0ABV7D7R4_9PROT|nr:HAD family phosphatase [Kordiimonas pumila]
MKQISAVLFDIGNVFVRWDPRYLYEKLIADPVELDFFLTNVVTLAWHTEHDRGRPFAEGVRKLSAQFPEYEDLIQSFDTKWAETIGETITGTVDVLGALVAEGMPVYAITNFSAEKWPLFCKSYAFTDLFDGVVVSGEEKLVKPDPALFDIAIKRFGLVPEETFFIDDRFDNIRAAEKIGMQCHTFRDPATLKKDLWSRRFRHLSF